MFSKQVTIPIKVIENTFSFLQEYGKQNLESHVLWIGKKETKNLEVIDVIFPKQENFSISFYVSAEEVHRINVEMQERQLNILSQVHTHPCEAYHSQIDDDGAYLTRPDSLSIVIPNFGQIQPTNLDEWAVYYFDDKEWKAINKNEVRRQFKIA